jgi:hypothetical protein
MFNLLFNGEEEHRMAPLRQIAEYILRGAQTWMNYLQGVDRGRPGKADGL